MPGFFLPAAPHIPGKNPRPGPGPVAEIAAAATPPGAPPESLQRAWEYGMVLAANGFYWEAHEVLEPVWMAQAPNSPERLLVQAVIQFANACLKVRMGRPNAAARLATIAADGFREAGKRTLGCVFGVDCTQAHQRAVTFSAALARNTDQEMLATNWFDFFDQAANN